ncbi:hypothetical protein MMC22_007440 [Lobaria immixta]|nr:hypothetical protein [Lobaria immixta]
MGRVFGEEQAMKQFENVGPNIDWLYRDIFYGLLLSNKVVLSMVKTQMMTCTALACEGLHVRLLLVIHLGGLRNMGARLEQAEVVMLCVKMVAKWAGKDTGSWLSVKELIPGWEIEK